MKRDELTDRARHLLGGRSRVPSERNLSEGENDLRKNALRQRHTGHSEARRFRRVRVDDCFDVRPVTVDGEVHRQLGRGVRPPRQLHAALGNDDDVVSLEESLGQTRRRHQNPVTQPGADVTVVGRDVAAIPESSAYLDDLASCLELGAH